MLYVFPEATVLDIQQTVSWSLHTIAKQDWIEIKTTQIKSMYNPIYGFCYVTVHGCFKMTL